MLPENSDVEMGIPRLKFKPPGYMYCLLGTLLLTARVLKIRVTCFYFRQKCLILSNMGAFERTDF